ncbi:MAG: acyl-CoA dehydrogenase family protein [bacterium]|nr:acyl-CoA dehydrogenase family protein [bacterium]
MLRLNLSAKVEAFRNEFRNWLNENEPPKVTDPGLVSFVKAGRAWQKVLAKGNWVAAHWPIEYGGRGLSLVEEAVVQEELVRVAAPQVLGLFGLTMVGPVLIKHGTTQQKTRYLSKIINADEIWCQGFSEPGAGSDLAAIKTKALKVEAGFKITGQKVWTSFAHIADWCFVLCRTSQTNKKHEGLTYLLVDMKSPGITVRPLKQISGDEEFNEVFFEEVFVPDSAVVGQVGQGWKIAISTLMFERVVLTFSRQLQSEGALREMIKTYDEQKHSHLKKELSRQLVNSCAVRALAYEHLIEYSNGKSPGPEGSLDKLFWSESFQEISKLSLRFAGKIGALSENSSENGTDMHRYLYSRGRTIAAGTSEIQRNIIAERLLGLPVKR